MDGQRSSLDEFWPFYVSQHLHPTTRRLHFAGTTLGLVLLLTAALRREASWLLAAPACGYAFAWAGHYFFEKNAAATFRHPLLSLRADLRLWRLTLTNEMDTEILLLSAKLKALRAGR